MSEEDVKDAVETAQEKVSRLSPRGLASISGEAGYGFLALSVALYAGAISINKFRSVYAGRGKAVI